MSWFSDAVKKPGVGIERAMRNYTVGGKLWGALQPDEETYSQEPMLTDEQKAAMKKIADFINSGEFGGFKAGSFKLPTVAPYSEDTSNKITAKPYLESAYSGPLGNFDMTDIEKAGLGNLSSMLSSGLPSSFSAGQNVLNDLLSGNRFNPLAEGSMYEPFKEEVKRNLAEATGGLKNKLAFSGNLYSTTTGKQARKLQEGATNTLTGKLAELYQNYGNQITSAIPQALNYATTEQNLRMAPIQAAMQYGGLERNLMTAKQQADYQEALRVGDINRAENIRADAINQAETVRMADRAANLSRSDYEFNRGNVLSEYLQNRQEMMMPLQAAQGLLGQNIPYGVKDITVQQPSQLAQILQMGAQLAPLAMAFL